MGRGSARGRGTAAGKGKGKRRIQADRPSAAELQGLAEAAEDYDWGDSKSRNENDGHRKLGSNSISYQRRVGCDARAWEFPLELDEAEEISQLAQAEAKNLVSADGELLTEKLEALFNDTGVRAVQITKSILSHLPFHLLVAFHDSCPHPRSLLTGNIMNSSLMAADQRERTFWLSRQTPSEASDREAAATVVPPLKTNSSRAVRVFGEDGKQAVPRLFFKAALDADEEAHPKVHASSPALSSLDASIIVANSSIFNHNLVVFSRGMLDGVLGRGAFLGGSAVFACLLRSRTDEELMFERYCLLQKVLHRAFSCKGDAEILGSNAVFHLVLQFAGEEDWLRVLEKRFNDIGSPYYLADLDVNLVATSRQHAAIRLAEAVERVTRNMEAHGRTTLVRTPNGVTVCGQWPLRHVQLVTHVFESIDESLSFADLDCTALAFDGYHVWAAPRAIRALSKGYNFVPPKMILHRKGQVQRIAKYCVRGVGSLCFELCKHQPRCDVCIDRATWRSLAAAEALGSENLVLDHALVARLLEGFCRGRNADQTENWEAVAESLADSMCSMRRAGVSILPQGPGIDSEAVEAYIRALPHIVETGLLQSPPLMVVSSSTDSTPLHTELLPFVSWFREKGSSWNLWGMIPRMAAKNELCCKCGSPLSVEPALSCDATPESRDQFDLGATLNAVLEAWKPPVNLREHVTHCLEELRLFVEEHLPDGPSWRIGASGSSVNGFGCRDTDIDAIAYESLDDRLQCKHGAKQMLEILVERAETSQVWTVSKSVFNANVPLVKLLFKGHTEVDLTINNTQPLEETRCLVGYTSLDERISQLGILVKLWAKSRKVCGAAHGHLSSYTITMMTIYFLQVGDTKMPSLQEGPDGSVLTEDRVNAVRKEWRLDKPLTDLFCGFFSFYARDFCWGREVVSMRLGLRKFADSGCFSRLSHTQKVRLHVEDAFHIQRNTNDTLLPGNEQKLRAALVAMDNVLQQGRPISIPPPATIGMPSVCRKCQSLGQEVSTPPSL